MKIALVHDDLIQDGGAERVFFHIAELFPEASIFTSVISKEWKERFKGREIKTSFLQKPYESLGLYKQLFFLYPFAFESFDFSRFDLVISTSSRYAHSVITKPGTVHVSYAHSPSRQLWRPNVYFKSRFFRVALLPFLSLGRVWDTVCSERADVILANSNEIRLRIKKIWRRDSSVLYPYVEGECFLKKKRRNKKYFLLVSRLTYWKRIDVAIEACKALNLSLKIVGTGPFERDLKKMAGEKVEFLGKVSKAELLDLYSQCVALIMPQREDFGIISLEAQGAGRPVIAFGKGGALETVKPGITGEFFLRQTSESLSSVLSKFDPGKYNFKDCVENARRFSKGSFDRNLLKYIKEAVEGNKL